MGLDPDVRSSRSQKPQFIDTEMRSGLAVFAAAAVSAFMNGFSHFGLGWSWGGFESLIVPAHIKRTVSPFRAEGPVLRIQAGLEDAQDLIADLERAFIRLEQKK